MIRMSYIINRENKKKKISSVIKMDIPYVMKPNLKKRDNMLEIKEILIVDNDIKKNMCNIQFDRLFKRLTKIVLEVIDDSTNEGDSIIALNEILHAKEIVLDQYLHATTKQEIKKMLKKLEYLEEQLKQYIINLNMQNYLNNNQEKAKGR